MISYQSTPEFRKHSENVAAVRRGLKQIERAHKRAIRDNDEPAVATLRRFHLLTVGVLAEAVLRKIVTDPGGFNDRERDIIWRQGSQVERWKLAVDLAFRRHYSVLVHQELADVVTNSSVTQRYDEVIHLISNDLEPVIQDRNKSAHGQWAWQLKSRKENEFTNGSAPAPPNYSAIQAQSELIESISELVYVLAVSEPTFDREYARITTRIDESRLRLDGSSYPSFVAQLSASRQRFLSHVEAEEQQAPGSGATRRASLGLLGWITEG